MKIHRAAVGRFAKLGDLYDARNDSFQNKNALKCSLTDADIWTKELNLKRIAIISSASLKEKFDALDVDAELGLSISSGLVELTGSAVYLNIQKDKANSPQCTAIYTLKTKTEEVFFEAVCSKLSAYCLKGGEATHIVVGIEWGARCITTVQYQKSQNEDEVQVKNAEEAVEAVEAEMQKLICPLLDFNQTTNPTHPGKGNDLKFFYKIYCDLRNLEYDIPTTFEEAVAASQLLPKEVSKNNHGKGIPMTYTLLPVKPLCKMCKVPTELVVISKQIKEDVIKKCFETIQAISNARQQINDLIEVFNRNRCVVPCKDFDAANKLLNKFEVEEANFKSILGKALVETRSDHKKELLKIDDVITFYLDRDSSLEKINAMVRMHERTIQKLNFVNKFIHNGVLYIGQGKSLEKDLLKCGICIVVYMDCSKRYARSKEWKHREEQFFSLLSACKDDKEIKIIVVDCEFHDKLTPRKGICIEFYDHGSIRCLDLLEDTENCVIEVLAREEVELAPTYRVPFKTICPNACTGACSNIKCEWVFMECKHPVECVVDEKCLYCKCGKANISDSMFRCNDVNHGLLFKKFDLDTMKQILSSIKQTTILLLGETGVGKSTWINAIANYLAFARLKDAKDANDMKVCIPSKFTHYTDDGVEHTISIGSESENEVLESGKSATQGIKAHYLSYDMNFVTLLDTPGIGDVRGTDRDEENFENILAYLSQCSKIHGICIFLKSNESRLTATFRFCILELLTHLHKSAAENVVFCFTYTRSTFYKPGQTLSTLKALFRKYKSITFELSNETLYCFDNEAFRFLACLQNGVQFSDEDIGLYSSSWDKAAEETKRLFEHIQKITPHSIQHTVSLNNARKIIIELSKPLAEIAATIQKNLDLACVKAKLLMASRETTKDLQDQLYLDTVEVEMKHLDYPRTVCTDGSCVKYIQIAGSNQKTDYIQQCHEHCFLDGVKTETVDNVRLQYCAAMIKDESRNCGECGHSWRVHMHITYDLVEKIVRTIDENKRNLLSEEKDNSEKLYNFIKRLEDYSQEMKDEQTVITNICAQFGSYLRKNAITPFNDAIDSHLQLLIKNEENMPSPNQSTIDNLKTMRRRYEQQKDIIYKAMEQPGSSDVEFISEPARVEELKEKLFCLKHNGSALKKIFEDIRKVRHQYSDVQIVPGLSTSMSKKNASAQKKKN